MTETQQEKKEQALLNFLTEKMKTLTGANFYGSLLIEFRNGKAEKVEIKETQTISGLLEQK